MHSKLLVILIVTNAALSIPYRPCQLQKFDKGYVCVCNETYCDTLDFTRPTTQGEYVLISSSKSGHRFVSSKGYMLPDERPVQKPLHDIFYSVIRVKRKTNDKDKDKQFLKTTVTLDRSKKYQEIIGFGGAFTGTVSYLLDSLPESLRHTIYRDYFSETDGIGYNLLRIPIGGSDFDMEPWAYNETPVNDILLTNFTELDPRDLHRVNQIKEMMILTQNNKIKLMGAAWSSPKWMKTNNEWSGRGSLKSEYYQLWADYHLKYLRLMAKHNLTFWAISTGNEPLNGEIAWFFIRFMSLGWTPKDQGKWVGENLGPTLRNSEMRNVKIFAGDDQRYTFPWWFQRMDVGNSNAMNYVSGLAVHWYWDQFIPPIVLDQAHEKYPDRIILTTESCLGDKPYETHGPELGSWDRAEHYALIMMQNFEHWNNGWIDWNLVLDMHGGPSYVNNFVDAAIIVNTKGRTTEIYKQPIFYVLAHFSKFVSPSSIRIDVNVNNNNIKSLAFLCPDSSIAIILYNNGVRTITVGLTDEMRGSMEIRLLPKSINTLIYI